jgi:uncharacterized membrane protein
MRCNTAASPSSALKNIVELCSRTKAQEAPSSGTMLFRGRALRTGQAIAQAIP